MAQCITNRKNAFREDLKRWLKQLGSRYFALEYDGKKYCDEVASLKTHLNNKQSNVLSGGNVKIGVCQKAITLYLKYLWLRRQFKETYICNSRSRNNASCWCE